MIEENSRTGEQPVCLTVVGNLPKGSRLGNGIGASRMKWRFLVRGALDVAEAFAGASIIELGRDIDEADSFEDVQRADADALKGLHRLLEGKSDGTLSRQVIQFIGLDL